MGGVLPLQVAVQLIGHIGTLCVFALVQPNLRGRILRGPGQGEDQLAAGVDGVGIRIVVGNPGVIKGNFEVVVLLQAFQLEYHIEIFIMVNIADFWIRPIRNQRSVQLVPGHARDGPGPSGGVLRVLALRDLDLCLYTFHLTVRQTIQRTIQRTKLCSIVTRSLKLVQGKRLQNGVRDAIRRTQSAPAHIHRHGERVLQDIVPAVSFDTSRFMVRDIGGLVAAHLRGLAEVPVDGCRIGYDPVFVSHRNCLRQVVTQGIHADAGLLDITLGHLR